jgi:hypothetical protein
MWRPSRIIFVLSLLGFAPGQVYNAFGIGSEYTFFNAPSLGIGSGGLVPTYQQDLSLDNPSTWHRMSFTNLSSDYGGLSSVFTRDQIQTGRSNIRHLQLIIPFRERWAMGFGLRPYSDQTVTILSSLPPVILQGDTLSVEKRFIGSGGMNAFSAALDIPVTTSENVAISFDFLFGSTRHRTELSLAGDQYQYFRRHIFSGVITRIFVHTDRIKIKRFQTDTYFRFGYTLRPLAVRTYAYQPFEDNNGSGTHDRDPVSFRTDFPDPSLVPGPIVTYRKRQYEPVDLAIGLALGLQPRLQVLSELGLKYDRAVMDRSITILDDQVDTKGRWNLGLIRFPSKLPRSLLDRMVFRIGGYTDWMHLKQADQTVIENGLTFGIGFIFGVTKNQIDLAYLFGYRNGLEAVGPENIQRFMITLTIGDIWFVKRRGR